MYKYCIENLLFAGSSGSENPTKCFFFFLIKFYYIFELDDLSVIKYYFCVFMSYGAFYESSPSVLAVITSREIRRLNTRLRTFDIEA